MAKPKVQFVALAKIVNKFDVRIALDDDRVLQFVSLYQNGVDLPPVKLIRIDEDSYAYVDGRHRGAARAYMNLEDVLATIVDADTDPVDLFAQALQANWGGSKPPTRDDITHTVLRMIELGATQKAIREKLSFMPPAATSAHISWAKSVLHRRALSRALDSVSEGLSVDLAAKTFGLKPTFLKDVISGKKGRWGAARSSEQQIAVELKAYISRQLFSANAGISKKITLLLKRVDEGEVSSKIASGIIKAWSEHLRRSAIKANDWQARLDAISSEGNNVRISEEISSEAVQ